jgi:hypothetical protein
VKVSVCDLCKQTPVFTITIEDGRMSTDPAGGRSTADAYPVDLCGQCAASWLEKIVLVLQTTIGDRDAMVRYNNWARKLLGARLPEAK